MKCTKPVFVGSIFTPWALPVAIPPLTVTLIGWFWPKKRDHAREMEEHAGDGTVPPEGRLRALREARA